MAEVELVDVCRELKRVTGQPDLDCTYLKIWRGIVNGEIRAVKRRNRWFAEPIKVAEDLGLAIKSTQSI